MPGLTRCDECNALLKIGDFPFCKGDPARHQPVAVYHPFVPFFDIGMGREVTSLADWNRGMRDNKLELRSKYDPLPVSQNESGRRLRKWESNLVLKNRRPIEIGGKR